MVTIKVCPSGCELTVSRKFCYKCGAKLIEKLVDGCCGYPWKNWTSAVRFCPDCGSPRQLEELEGVK